MKIGDEEYKTVFFLGAGASRGALSHVVLHKKRIRPPLNRDFFQVAKTYARAEGSDSAASRRLTRLLKVFERDLPAKGIPPMEDAFSLLYVAKDLPEIYNHHKGRPQVAGERKEISDFLYLLFPILCLLDQSDRKETGYDRLATALTDGDTLITLNYDTMLDSALHRRGWDPKVGYRISGNTDRKVKWASEPMETGRPLQVDLLKLHGSLNWFVRGTPNSLKRVFTNKPVLVTKPRWNEKNGHIRQIAPPIYGKIFEHEHWRKLWTTAFNAMCDAEVIVIIGCSLIDTDFHLRALLSQVARTRKQRDDKFRCAAFVDNTKTRRKWEAILKGSFKKSYSYNNFEKFLRKALNV